MSAATTPTVAHSVTLQRQQLLDVYGRLVELAADAVRLRTDGEPLRACDSQVQDVRACQLAIELRKLADHISRHIPPVTR